MQKCPNCGQQNRPGVIFCENCGASLIGKLPLSTKALDSTDSEQAELGVDASILTDVSIQGTATFERGMGLRLEVEGTPDPIHFSPKSETIFGRRDPATGDKPDIDLTPFAGYRMGVSRRHAAIRPGDENGLDLWDLGSSNGTFLNGQRLSAHRPYRLRDGDEIRLGQMVVRIHFERESSRTPIPAPLAGRPETAAAPSEPEVVAPVAPESSTPAATVERPTEPFPSRSRPVQPAAPVPGAPKAEPPAEKPAAEPTIKSDDQKPAMDAPAADVPAVPERKPDAPPTIEPPVPTAPEQPKPAEPTLPAEPPAQKPVEPPVTPDAPAQKPEVPSVPAEAPPVEPPVPTAPEQPKPVEPPLPAEPPGQKPVEPSEPPPQKPPEPPRPDDEKSG